MNPEGGCARVPVSGAQLPEIIATPAVQNTLPSEAAGGVRAGANAGETQVSGDRDRLYLSAAGAAAELTHLVGSEAVGLPGSGQEAAMIRAQGHHDHRSWSLNVSRSQRLGLLPEQGP